jgi:hypothetical protein
MTFSNLSSSRTKGWWGLDAKHVLPLSMSKRTRGYAGTHRLNVVQSAQAAFRATSEDRSVCGAHLNQVGIANESSQVNEGHSVDALAE